MRHIAISLKNTFSTPLKGRHREVALGTNMNKSCVWGLKVRCPRMCPRTISWPLVKMELHFFCFSVVIFFSVTTSPQENDQLVQVAGPADFTQDHHSRQKKGPQEALFGVHSTKGFHTSLCSGSNPAVVPGCPKEQFSTKPTHRTCILTRGMHSAL